MDNESKKCDNCGQPLTMNEIYYRVPHSKTTTSITQGTIYACEQWYECNSCGYEEKIKDSKGQ